MTQRTHGFTLIELMIVLAIIAILAALAVPWYGRYTHRAHRADGQRLLMHVAQMEERYYTDFNHYPLTAASLGFTTNTPVSENGYYNVTLAAAPSASAGQGYVATAAPLGPQADDVCGSLSIDNTGQKLPAPTDAAHNSNGSCW